MLWNWYTIDSCFLSRDWKITSAGGFAGLCFGVILMAILLQFLGWAAKFYDRRLVRNHKFNVIASAVADLIPSDEHQTSPTSPFRPNMLEQVARAAIRTMQFALGYWIMLMAMYYNGYIIVCIILGNFIGTYIFQWERLGGAHGGVAGGHLDPTGCCG
jgi:solute carrier family 31 (copper transporter), member 1